MMIVTKDYEVPLKLSEQEQQDGVEIEKKIIADLVQRHAVFLA